MQQAAQPRLYFSTAQLLFHWLFQPAPMEYWAALFAECDRPVMRAGKILWVAVAAHLLFYAKYRFRFLSTSAAKQFVFHRAAVCLLAACVRHHRRAATILSAGNFYQRYSGQLSARLFHLSLLNHTYPNANRLFVFLNCGTNSIWFETPAELLLHTLWLPVCWLWA